MSPIEKKIAFRVEFSRILELLADQIYQSPLALLRENTQNAFDAICLRRVHNPEFDPSIAVVVDDARVTVTDNGIGMTASEIETNFWYAGRSGKNTDAARAAGVVGTFGIGAMANFGVATELLVESESMTTGERTRSSVRKTELSTDAETISLTAVERKGEPGTRVEAVLARPNAVAVHDARAYLREFVEFVDVPVLFNDEQLSGATHRSVLPSERHAWTERRRVSLAGIVAGDLELYGMASGELRVVMENVETPGRQGRPGAVVLLQDRHAIRTCRSGFGLSTVAIGSLYDWGGVVDLSILKPTAGREALDASSNEMLQRVVQAIDRTVSPMAAGHEESLRNDGFLSWIVSTKQFDLCGALEVVHRPPGSSEPLSSLVERSGVTYYGGRDESVIQTHASEEAPVVVLSRRKPRRDCELGYLRTRGVNAVDPSPHVICELSAGDRSFAHSALATRVAMILEDDYFLGVDIRFGTLSSGLAILVTDKGTPVVIFLDADSSSVAPLLALYRDDYKAFAPFVKDFVRSVVFPRISALVPSSTREGAEAFLRHLRSNRELFEYELDDRADLEEILEELRAGRLTASEAARHLSDRDRSIVNVSRGSTALLSTVLKELREQGDEVLVDDFGAKPGIDRREEETNALILTSEEPVNGYCCFLALSDRVQREKGEFFMQPHSTEIVWGGRKVILVFQHHSGQFGLYYDILCPGLIGAPSGGGRKATSTILTRKRTFIPISDEIRRDFVPEVGERKRLEVRCEILYLGG